LKGKRVFESRFFRGGGLEKCSKKKKMKKKKKNSLSLPRLSFLLCCPITKSCSFRRRCQSPCQKKRRRRRRGGSGGEQLAVERGALKSTAAVSSPPSLMGDEAPSWGSRKPTLTTVASVPLA